MLDMKKEFFKVIDNNLALVKGLFEKNEPNDKFYRLYTNYKILLEEYLMSKLSLKMYDDILCNSELSFVPISEENMDFYQYICSMKLKYIYLRNDLCVEKLSLEDINVILNLDQSDLNLNEYLTNLIERTYKDVINTSKENVNQINCYGPDMDVFWINSKELVFGFRYDQFFDDGLSDEEWEENYFDKKIYLDKFIKEMSDKMSSIIGIKVNFLEFNEFTVKKSMKR